MATYLDVLVELLTDPAGRAAYLKHPAAWLHDAGVAFLCGEDIVAAGPVVTTWLPDLTTAFERLDAADPQPALGESELDAAVRVLAVLIEALPLEEPVSDLPAAEVSSFG